MNLEGKFQQNKGRSRAWYKLFFFDNGIHSVLYAALYEQVYNFKPTEQNPQSPSQSFSTAFKFSMFSFSLSRSLVLRVWTKDPWGSSRLSQRVHEIKTFILIILSHQYLLSKYLLSTKTKDICFFTVLTSALMMQMQWWIKLLVPQHHIKAVLSAELYSQSWYLPVFIHGAGGSFHLRVSDENSKND